MGSNKNIAHNEPCKPKNGNIVLFALLAIFLQVSTISASTNEVRSLIKSSCSSTLYPDLCISSLLSTEAAEASSTIKSPADVIKAVIKVTIQNVKINKIIIKKIAARKALAIRCKSALKDCLETLEDTIDELKKVILDLKTYPSTKITKEDLMTLLSAAKTNLETCIDGFSHDESDEKVRSEFLNKQIQVAQLCSNTLAMIKNMTGTSNVESNEEFMQERRLEEDEYDNSGLRWPKWLSAGDRKLLQTTVTPDVTVAADGSGNYRTVSEAVAAAPSGSTRRYVIRIKAGVYRENVEVPKAKTNLMFVGDGRSNTIITASRNVVDGSTTFNSATVG
ncbi:esterase [Lithospermum erythrorhizon]|uniref:Pectinesterase n=1 Tax=Lithospermum erythrorhizon TaxID=34254 RepID=A0AAV3QVS3_LITER